MNDAIQAAFAAQLPTALRLRQSTLAERKSKIRQLRDAVLAHQAEIIQEVGMIFVNLLPKLSLPKFYLWLLRLMTHYAN